MLYDHGHNRRHEYDDHEDWRQKPPRDLPVNARLVAGHVVDVLRELLVAVYVDDGDHLQQSDHDQPDSPGERVEHFQPVFAGARREDQTHEEANQTNDTCKLLLKSPAFAMNRFVHL